MTFSQQSSGGLERTALCPSTATDPLGHHSVTCKRGGDVVTHYSHHQNVFVDFCSAHSHFKIYSLMNGKGMGTKLGVIS